MYSMHMQQYITVYNKNDYKGMLRYIIKSCQATYSYCSPTVNVEPSKVELPKVNEAYEEFQEPIGTLITVLRT